MVDDIRLDICDGKYTYVLDESHRQYALRYGEPWRDLIGDKFVLALASELDEAKKALVERDAEIVRLREALMRTTAALAAAISAYDKFRNKGITGDALYSTRIKDFNKALDDARLALSALDAPQPSARDNVPLAIDYTNWRGERRERGIIPLRPLFGCNEWHKEPQWLLEAIDTDDWKTKTFSFAGMLRGHDARDDDIMRVQYGADICPDCGNALDSAIHAGRCGYVVTRSFDPATSPGHMDLMISPEAIDEVPAANPLPEELARPVVDEAGPHDDHTGLAIGYMLSAIAPAPEEIEALKAAYENATDEATNLRTELRTAREIIEGQEEMIAGYVVRIGELENTREAIAKELEVDGEYVAADLVRNPDCE